ncbi:MAG: RNA recognition motif domain-containing protein [bacterium]
MQGSTLYVGNLSYSVVDDDLIELFSNYGKVKYVNIFEDKGFGFVQMSNRSEAEKAKEALNNFQLNGRYMRVNKAFRRQDRLKQP